MLHFLLVVAPHADVSRRAAHRPCRRLAAHRPFRRLAASPVPPARAVPCHCHLLLRSKTFSPSFWKRSRLALQNRARTILSHPRQQPQRPRALTRTCLRRARPKVQPRPRPHGRATLLGGPTTPARVATTALTARCVLWHGALEGHGVDTEASTTHADAWRLPYFCFCFNAALVSKSCLSYR